MSQNKPDTSAETFLEGATTQSRPKSPTDACEDTFQEGTTPVQAFSTPVVPAGSENEIRLRQGRPPRAGAAKLHESAGIAGAAQAGT